MQRLVRSLGRRLRHGDATTTTASASLLQAAIDPVNLLPASALFRLGSEYGGWLIPSDTRLDENSICYLAGAGEDISFDCALVQRFGCRARIIDPTPRAIEHFRLLSQAVNDGRRFPVNNSSNEFYDLTEKQLARLSFLPVGLADRDVELKFYMPKNPAHVSCSTVNLQKTENYFMAQCHRLSTVMMQQGDEHIDLLKMDIEGGEYVVIKDMVESYALPRLLLIEFDENHTQIDENAGARISESVRRLIDAGMHCVAIEGCNATFVRTT